LYLRREIRLFNPLLKDYIDHTPAPLTPIEFTLWPINDILPFSSFSVDVLNNIKPSLNGFAQFDFLQKRRHLTHVKEYLFKNSLNCSNSLSSILFYNAFLKNKY